MDYVLFQKVRDLGDDVWIYCGLLITPDWQVGMLIQLRKLTQGRLCRLVKFQAPLNALRSSLIPLQNRPTRNSWFGSVPLMNSGL